MKLDEITDVVAERLNLPKKLVFNVYKLYWKSISEHITKLPLKEELSKEEFDALKTTFNIPSLGKLITSWDIVSRMKEHYKIKSKKGEELNDKSEEA